MKPNQEPTLSPQEIANDILETADSDGHAREMVQGFQAGLARGLKSWEAAHVERDAQNERVGSSLEFRKGWAIGQALGAVQRQSEGKRIFRRT